MQDATEIRDRLFYFRRRFAPRQPLLRPLLQPAPWVNVVLLVLMFFIANAAFVLQPGVVVDLPESAMTGGARFGSMVVTVAQEGMIFFNDERTGIDGLAPLLEQAARRDAEKTLVIEADSRVPHGLLIRIYNLALSAGVRKVVLATRMTAPLPPAP